jgi:hypothetical protein
MSIADECNKKLNECEIILSTIQNSAQKSKVASIHSLLENNARLLKGKFTFIACLKLPGFLGPKQILYDSFLTFFIAA